MFCVEEYYVHPVLDFMEDSIVERTIYLKFERLR